MILRDKKNWVRLAGTFAIIIILLASWKLLEYVSFRILVSKGLLPPNGVVQKQVFDLGLDLWTGGLDNTSNYHFRGYNESLKPGEMIYQDRYGLISGESTDVTKEKLPGVIRIMLTGGSGMKGIIQSWSVIKMFDYPTGTYDYATSIAGKLKHLLQLKYPHQKFEVINAAVVMHLFAQSYAAYYEKLHDFNPDIIINMDGYNDDPLARDFKDKGNPYLLTADQANEAIELEVLKRSCRWGYTCMLLNHLLLTADIEQGGTTQSISSVIHKLSVSDALRFAKEIKSDSINNAFVADPDSFRLLEPFMEQNMKKQLWLISSYENQLRHDNVYSIFCFQPMLARKGFQKKLSLKEQKMLDFMNQNRDSGDKPLPKLSFDTIFSKYVQGYSEELINAGNNTGACKYNIKQYYHQYFINHYVSPSIDSIVRSYGADYVDIGQHMTGLSDSIEFYVDYTHTTPYGNEFIAEIMAERVAMHLDTIAKAKKP